MTLDAKTDNPEVGELGSEPKGQAVQNFKTPVAQRTFHVFNTVVGNGQVNPPRVEEGKAVRERRETLPLLTKPVSNKIEVFSTSLTNDPTKTDKQTNKRSGEFKVDRS